MLEYEYRYSIINFKHQNSTQKYFETRSIGIIL